MQHEVEKLELFMRMIVAHASNQSEQLDKITIEVLRDEAIEAIDVFMEGREKEDAL